MNPLFEEPLKSKVLEFLAKEQNKLQASKHQSKSMGSGSGVFDFLSAICSLVAGLIEASVEPVEIERMASALERAKNADAEFDELLND